MSALPVLQQLPDDYVVEHGERDVVALHRDVRAAFHAAGYAADSTGPVEPSDLAGRRRMHQMSIGGECFVVRRFSHGGLLRWLTGTRFLDAERPFREILLSRELEGAGLPTPQVVAARARRRRTGGWRLEVVTRRVDDSLDLGLVLQAMGERHSSPRIRSRILHAAGALVRAMHNAGFFHADLTPNNLLVASAALTGGEPRMWILDLDRSDVSGSALSGADRRRNLRRLFRHVSKLRSAGRLSFSAADARRFLHGYEPDGGGWKELWRRVQRAHGRTKGAHALAGTLERRLGGGGLGRRQE